MAGEGTSSRMTAVESMLIVRTAFGPIRWIKYEPGSWVMRSVGTDYKQTRVGEGVNEAPEMPTVLRTVLSA